MKAATVSEIKRELNEKDPKELVELCLTLAKFKKENKELLTYLLYEAQDEEGFIRMVKREMDDNFEGINRTRFFFIKKSVRKILRNVKKYNRYSKKKTTEADLLIYFCLKLKNFRPSIQRNITLTNLYQRQIASIKKSVATMDEDLQFDYGEELKEL